MSLRVETAASWWESVSLWFKSVFAARIDGYRTLRSDSVAKQP